MIFMVINVKTRFARGLVSGKYLPSRSFHIEGVQRCLATLYRLPSRIFTCEHRNVKLMAFSLWTYIELVKAHIFTS